MNEPPFNSKAVVALRRAFCKDLCNELIVGKELPPIYPEWTRELAAYMIRLGWKKDMPKRF